MGSLCLCNSICCYSSFGAIYRTLGFEQKNSFNAGDCYTDLSVALQSSGNEIFYRNPYNVNENLFVSISSPSSSKYQTIDDLKSPDKAAERTKQQYLRELLSTRLGVKRTTDIVSAAERTEQDGRKYYDLEVDIVCTTPTRPAHRQRHTQNPSTTSPLPPLLPAAETVMGSQCPSYYKFILFL